MQTILIAEDDPALRKGLEVSLACEGYSVLTTGNCDEVIPLILRHSPDLLLLDVMFPAPKGFDVCREIRQKAIDIQIIFLTSRTDEIDRILGLELGADDYITKPFSSRELLARIHARLRRASRSSGSLTTFSFGNVHLDFTALKATKDGRPIPLTTREFDILRFLIQHAGEVVSREQLLRDVWGYEDYPLSRTVDTHISKLRQKLEDDHNNPAWIHSLYGAGYRFNR